MNQLQIILLFWDSQLALLQRRWHRSNLFSEDVLFFSWSKIQQQKRCIPTIQSNWV